MPFRKTKIIAAFLCILALSTMGGFWWLFISTSNQITDTISHSDELTVEIKKEETMSFMKQDIATGKMYQSSLYQYAISKDGLVGFLKIIDGLSASSSVTSQVNTVGYTDDATVSAISAQLVHINMSAVGDWNHTLYFLKLLENYPLQINIKNVSLNKYTDYTVKGKTIPQWTITIDFTVMQLQ